MAPAAASAQDGITKARSPLRRGTVSPGASLGIAQLMVTGTGVAYTFNLNPNAGYFISDHLMLSADLAGGMYRNTVGDQSGLSLGAGAGIRYYAGRPEKRDGSVNRLRFYAGASIAYSYYRSRWEETTTGVHREHGGELAVQGGIGINYLLSDAVAFESGLNYLRGGFEPYQHSGYGLLYLNFGVRAFLRRR